MVFWAAQVDIVALVKNQFGFRIFIRADQNWMFYFLAFTCYPATPSDEMLVQLKESERGLNDTVVAFPSSSSSVEVVLPL